VGGFIPFEEASSFSSRIFSFLGFGITRRIFLAGLSCSSPTLSFP